MDLLIIASIKRYVDERISASSDGGSGGIQTLTLSQPITPGEYLNLAESECAILTDSMAKKVVTITFQIASSSYPDGYEETAVFGLMNAGGNIAFQFKGNVFAVAIVNTSGQWIASARNIT